MARCRDGTQSMDGNHRLFNPDSGGHPLPNDPREIDAVLQATERCFDAHPYFIARYGERGRSFANSDGGYLVTLTYSWQSHVDEQVAWLAQLLSARGMPSWLMELHLQCLHQELRRRLPEGSTRFAKLRRAATRLRKLRCSRMAQEDFDAIAAGFDAAAGPDIANVGGLLAAAVCDERGGWLEAVPSLVEWLADRERFAPRWCGAVHQALADARASALPAV